MPKRVRKPPRSPESRRLKEAAMQAVINRLVKKGWPANFAALCREFSVGESAVRMRLIRHDIPTPERVEERRQDMLKELGKWGKILRPDGTTKCDEEAMKLLQCEGVKTPVVKRQVREEISPEAPETREAKKGRIKGGKFLKAKDRGNVGHREKRCSKKLPTESSMQAEAPISDPAPMTASPEPEPDEAKPPALRQSAQDEHDLRIAEITQAAVERVHKLGTLGVTRLSDLKICDDLHRRATGRTGSTGMIRPVIAVGFLGEVGSGFRPDRQESVRDEGSEKLQVVDVEPVETDGSMD